MNGLNIERPKLITNSNDNTIYRELFDSITTCNRFFFSVAFINYSGLQLLLDAFSEADDNNVRGKVIASTYLNFTDTKSLNKLHEFTNVQTKIYIADHQRGFHTKGYIFEYDDYYKIIVGSSNITQSALKSNVEWNVYYKSKSKSDEFAQEVITEFNRLWEHTTELNTIFLEQYEAFLQDIEAFARQEKKLFEHRIEIQENPMQKKALKNLESLRDNDQNRALIIAATGTGKTYLSAFDVKQIKAKRILFLVHREVILKDARKSFNNILPHLSTTIFQGKQKETNAEITFAMVPTMYNNHNYQLFAQDHFDYIIADEAHRAFSSSYKTIIEYFNPQFLLGMTATPERTDHGNIFEMFNNNIALEIRLKEALAENLVIPFHYFGIKDVTADLKDVDISNIDKLAERLSIRNRVDFIIEKLLHYEHSGKKRKCLAFCANKEHVNYMAESFNSLGFKSLGLTGESLDSERNNAVERLEDLNDNLEFIFTVDIFNEGIDIPSVNMVLMLRPTQSPIIFTQQLGRGLRKHPDKEFLTVIDFIGNHNKTYLIPIALSGARYYEKDSLKVQVHKDFSDIPGCSNIFLDKIAKEDILKQLDHVNLNNMEFLKKEYQEFKKILGGKIPELSDYALFDSSPDPIKFVAKEKSYIEFVAKMEKDKITMDEKHLDIQQTLDKSLPIKRINEFVILQYLFNHSSISVYQAKKAIQKIIIDVEEESIVHSFNYLNGEFLTAREKNPFWFISKSKNNDLVINKLVLHKLPTILETLKYGILRYQEEFGKEKMKYPYLKLYYPYKMKDMGLLTNYEKSFSSIRGSGVWRHGNHYYLFVDLHKGEVKESINYKDKLLSQNLMQWETQNKTSQDTEIGRELCFNRQKNIELHMFVRKAKKIGSQNLDYLYIGKVNTKSFKGNKPITLQFELENPLPKNIYDDLTLKIEKETVNA